MFIKGTLNIETKHLLENYNCMNVGLYISSSFRFYQMRSLLCMGPKKEQNKLNCHHTKNCKSFKDSHSLKLDVYGGCILRKLQL